MQTRTWMTVLAVASMLAAGCASSEPERQQLEQKAQEAAKEAETRADQAEDAARKTGQGAEQMAKGFEQLAKGLGQLAGSKHEPVDPVSFRALYDFFPDLSGWEKNRPTGERTTSPIRYAEAKTTYKRGDSEIDASIVDSGFNQVLMAPFAMFLTGGFERETEDGYEKALKVEGFPAWEKWDNDGRGELNALVGERFLLRLEGTRLSDNKVLHELAAAANLSKLADLK